ncbi:MAG: choice-of-anchor J domain-containing protein [Prevotella sp.]|nr:choice-of-anchor J domain-containing protein [Prevotella sp.]
MKARRMFKALVAVFAMLALSQGQTAKAEELTVYDGTAESMCLPAYIYCFETLTRSQFVIPEVNLRDMVGATISELTFYTTSSNIPYTAESSADVYLKEVEYTSIEAFEAKSSATVVYTGYFNIVEAGNGGQMTITFDTPYQYQGGNLLIGIENTEAFSWRTITFIGQEVTGASVESTAGNNFFPYQQNFIPKTTFTYSASGFVKPKNLTCALTPGDATVAALSWTELGTATQWILQYGTDPDFNTYTQQDVSGTPSVSLTGLTPEQTYYARVKSVDGEGNESSWSQVISFMPTNIYTLTVNDGTETNEFLPIYGWYCDTQTLSQYIIKAEDLSTIANAVIEKLTYYIDAESVDLGDAKFDVYMGEVSQAVFTDAFVDWNALSKVYSGSVTIADNKMEITLDTPYEYNGRNLVIGFKQTTSGSFPHTYWYGVEATATAFGGYDTTLGIQDFLPKTTFNYTPGVPPSCFKPKDLALVAEPTYNSAQLQWTPGNADQTVWDFAYKAVGDADFTNVKEVSANPYTLTGLQPETRYDVRVRGNCGGDDVSKWTGTISFITPEQYPKPTELMVDNIRPNTADVSWKSSAPDFELQYIKGAFGPEGGYCYDNNEFETTFSDNGGEYSWGVMFPAGEYVGNRLSKVFLYDSELMEATLTIYNDGYNEPSYQIATQTITFIGKGDYMEIDLNNLEIDENKNVWVVLTGTKAPVGGNMSYNAYGRWVNVGNGWEDIANYDYGFEEYAFLIHALFEGDTPMEWTTMTDIASPHTLTGLDAETTYTVRLRAIYAGEGSESKWVGSTFQTPEANPIPFDVDIAAGCKSATISWSGFGEEYNVKYRKLATVTPSENGLDEDFENGLDNWTVLRKGEGIDDTDWQQYTPSASSAHSGDVARSKSCDSSNAYNVDNWLISPAVELNGILSYWVYDDGYYHDHYDVYVSTTRNDIADFQLLYEPGEATNKWVQHTVDLSSYSGKTGYIAFRHTDYDQNYLYIDDVKIGSGVIDSWNLRSTQNNSIQLLNILEPGTTYEFQIESKKEGMDAKWTSTYYFTTSDLITPGDVNDDTKISIADVTALVHIVLGKDDGDTPVYDHTAADMNNDGDINIDDVKALVNILLGM